MLVDDDAAAITTLPAGLVAVTSALVLTVKFVFVNVCAAGFVTPATVRVAAVLAGSEQVPPLSASVAYRVVPDTVAVAEQFVKPLAGVTVGVAGRKNPLGKTIVSVSPVRSAPVELFAPTTLEVSPTVQTESALPVCGEPAKLIAEGAVAPPTTTLDAGCTTVVSELVFMLNVLARSVPGVPGFVIPGIENEAAVLMGTEHVPPLFASVIVTVVVAVEAVAEQFVKPLPRLIVGVAAIAKFVLNPAVIVLPLASAPAPEVVKLAVQVERALCCCGEPLYETPETLLAAVIETELSLTEVVSLSVLTVIV
jgi:hypothetical protein